MEKAVVTIGANGIIRSANQCAVIMFGYTRPNELIGQNVSVLCPHPYKEQHDSYLQHYHETGVPKVIGKSRVVEGQKKDGTIFPIRLAISELVVGEEIFYCGLVEELEDQSCLITIDAKGIILSVNGKAAQLFGYKKAEMLGQNISVLVDEAYADKHDSFIQRYIHGGVPRVLNRVRNLIAMHKDGHPITISLEVHERREGDHIIFVGKINQITEEMEAIITIDKKGIIQDVNQNLWVLYGYSREELLGKKINMLMCSPHSQMHDTYLRRYHQTGKKRIIGMPPRMVKTRHKDGSTFYVYLEVNEFDQAGQTLYGGKISRVLRHRSSSSVGNVRGNGDGTGHVDDHSSGGGSDLDEPVYIGNYKVENTIAEGLYGKVKIAIHRLTGQKVVLKVIERSKIDRERFREIALMKQLRHKHVVRMLEVIESVDRLFIVYEFVDGGELYDYMMSKQYLTEDEARQFWRQIVMAVKYMHTHNIAHRDLKLENVMLNSRKEIVVIDLGLGNFMKADELLSTFCGSTAYAAPEMFLCQDYVGSHVDIWSMGVMLFCLVLGFLPFEDPQRIVQADFVPFSEAEEDGIFVSDEFADLITRIFQKDPAKRITIDGIINHPWTTKGLPPITEAELQSSESVDVAEQEELLNKLKEFGFEQDVVLKSINAHEFNAITASFFLLQRQMQEGRRNRTRSPAHTRRTGTDGGGGGGCPFAHHSSA